MPKYRFGKCPVCKTRPLSTVVAKRCQRCYRERRGYKSQRKKWICEKCGTESSYGAKRCLDCYWKRGPRKKATPIPPPPDIRPVLTTFEEAWTLFQSTIGMMRDRYRGPAKPRKKGKRQRILVIPDLHIPFHEPEMLADMIAREEGNVDVAIMIGDVGDAYSLSRYAKYESVPYDYEWAEVTNVMQTLSETFPEVRVIVGNHDARLRKAIAAHLNPDMVKAITTMTPGGTLCPLTALARRYPNVSIANHPVPNSDITIDWLTVIGDALLAHPEKYSRVPGSALRAFEEWASDNSAAIGLDNIKLLVMGHTHTMAILPWRSSSLLVECGCLCRTQSYMTAAAIGGRPQRRSYVWFEQENGITDMNSLGWSWFDVEDGPWRKK